MSLEIEALRFSYRGKPILDDFGLSLASGEQSLLLGPSGSGKTTLIYLMCGLLTPESGAVRIAGDTISALPQSKRDAVRRRSIGVVFQTLRLVSALRVIDNLKLARKLSGKTPDAAMAASLLDRLGIAHRAQAKPSQLSQGEAQRAAIARALVVEPSLLIADEPTSALDDHNTEIVARLLVDAAKSSGASLLIATHDSRLKAFVPNSVHLDAPGAR
jgi:putative ABC transport system ATP-binding protein